MVVAIALSFVFWVWGKKVPITDMPQMVALQRHGRRFGGGDRRGRRCCNSARATPAPARRRHGGARLPGPTKLVLAVLGSLIGAVSFSGSVIAWAKLDGRMDKRLTSRPAGVNLLVFVARWAWAPGWCSSWTSTVIIAFFVLRWSSAC
jgi:H+-translocating NAD(P) transhydrogenase subunit beta